VVGTPDDGSDLSAAFSLSNTTGSIRLVQPRFDFEYQREYALTIVVTDRNTPPISVTMVARVRVVDVNERPVVSASRVQLDENSPVGTRVGYPIVARDQDVDRPGSTQSLVFGIAAGPGGVMPPFEISPQGGQISVAADVLNFEATSVYNVTVTVTDDGTPSLSASAVVQVRHYITSALCRRCAVRVRGAPPPLSFLLPLPHIISSSSPPSTATPHQSPAVAFVTCWGVRWPQPLRKDGPSLRVLPVPFSPPCLRTPG
jgi:hypothetical protein